MLIKDVYQRQAVMADRRSPPVSLRLVTEGNPHWANPGLNDGFVKLHVICEMRTEEGKSIFLQAKGAPPLRTGSAAGSFRQRSTSQTPPQMNPPPIRSGEHGCP